MIISINDRPDTQRTFAGLYLESLATRYTLRGRAVQPGSCSCGMMRTRGGGGRPGSRGYSAPRSRFTIQLTRCRVIRLPLHRRTCRCCPAIVINYETRDHRRGNEERQPQLNFWRWRTSVSRTLIIQLVFVMLIAGLPPQKAMAYRPFESTDAGVPRAGQLEIEWGALTIERQDGDNTYVAPDLVFNYGLSDRTEIIGEFVVERTPQKQWELAEPGVFIKHVWKAGVLQNESGLSVATEVGALLPGTREDEDGVGSEAIVIISGKLNRLTLHFNAGGGTSRIGSDSFALVGLIAEYPISDNARLVSEINGEKQSGVDWEASVLVGAIIAPNWFGGEIDLGLRRGLTAEAPDWSVTVGATIAF